MKNLLTVAFTLSLLMLTLTVTKAQECFGMPIKEGGGYEMTSLNAKGKPQGTIKYRFTSVKKEGDYTVVDIEMESVSTKGKTELTQKFTIKCNGNEYVVDAASFVAQEQLKSLESFNMTFKSDDVVYPNQLSEGQTLKDASLTGTGDMNGIPVSFDMKMTDRKVVGRERIKVGAGEYDAFKITTKSKMTTKTVISVNVDFETVSYRAPGVIWDIKTETYRKGKLLGSTELSKIY